MSVSDAHAPVTFVVDYDGTISLTDISDTILARHVRGVDWQERDDLYQAGLIGSRDLLEWDATLLPDDEPLLFGTAMEQPLDPGFPDFVAMVRRWGASMEIVSDGFGWYIPATLERLGVGVLPVATARTTFGTGTGHPAITFPAGHPACFVCGTCKRERVREAHRRGDIAVVIGDGMSDRYGAAHAEAIFAKGRLAELCDIEGWPYTQWESFAEITAWADAAFQADRLPRDASGLDAARRAFVAARWPGETVAVHPEERHFVCGPEVWGPGLHDPPPGTIPGSASRRNR